MLSAPDATVVHRDPTLPGLALLFDEDRFAEALSRSVPQLHLERVRATYVRYKPGRNCLVGYEARTPDGEVLLHAKTHGSDASEKLAKARTRRTVRTAYGPGRLIWERWDTVVSFFPNDAKVRSLPDLIDPARRDGLLRSLGSGPAPEATGTSEPGGAIEFLAYKPERRFVERMSIGGRPTVVKLHSRGRSPRVFTATACEASPRVRLPAAWGLAAAKGAMALEWLPGRVLLGVLQASDIDEESLAENVSSVGAALQAFHGMRPADMPPRTPADELARARRAAEHTAIVLPRLGRTIERALARLESSLPAGVPRTLIHGDFYAKQVVLGATVGLIDLDQAARGMAASDLGCFVAHLERDEDRGRLPSGLADIASEAFLEGYQCAGGELPPDLQWYIASALLQLAPDPFRKREPLWPELTETLVRRALDRLPSSAPPATRRRRDTEAFPRDPAMPFLRDAVDPVRAQRAVARGWGEHLGRPGGLRVLQAELVRHKPGRRALIAYEAMSTSSDASVALLGKARAKGLDHRTPVLIGALRHLGFGDGAADGIHVPAAAGRVPEFRMWLQHRVDAHPISARLRDPESYRPQELGRRLAATIHKLHMTPLAVSRPHGIEEELAILTARLESVWQTSRHPDLPRLLDACRRVGASIPSSTPCVLHRDFYPDQVLQAEDGRIFLIDLDLVAMGDPALDVGNFVAHLTEQALRDTGRAAANRNLEEAIVDEYCRRAPGMRPRTVAAYAALSLARHVYISTLFPKRRHTTQALIALCLERTSELEAALR